MKRLFYIVLGIAVLLFGLGFAYKNPQMVEFNYYFDLHWEAPLAQMLLVTFVVGASVGILASLRMVIRMQRQLVSARREIRQMEQEVINLRSLPIKDVL